MIILRPQIVTILLLLFVNNVFADEFKIINFHKASKDLAAIRFQRSNINGEKCALIKIRTDLSGLSFNSNIGIVGDVQKKEGDYWVYVSPGDQRIKFFKSGFISKSYSFPEPIESSTVYVLKLTNNKNKVFLDKELVKIIFRFNVNKVYISKNNGAPVHSMGKVAEFKLPPGNHSFKFSKQGYKDIKEEIVITQERVMDISLEEGNAETSLDLPGIITIKTDPAGANVYLNNQKIGITPFVDQVIAGNYDLTLKKDLYASYSGVFAIKEGETKELPVIKLKPITGKLKITSNVEGANIFINGKQEGVTPLENIELVEGRHKIRLEHPEHHTKEKTILLKAYEQKDVSFTLAENYGTLLIDSEPEGANVYLDGNKLGVTPFKSNKISPGEYILKVDKESLNTETEQITISENQVTKKIMVLTSNYGVVKIKAPGSNIMQNDKDVGFDYYEAKLDPGKYTFIAVRKKHTPDKEDIFLSVGDVREITLEPKAKKGSISLISEPMDTQGAEIYIDGILQPNNTPAVIPLLIGNYDIIIKKEGFADFKKEVNIEKGDNQKIIAQMQTYQGSMQQKFNKYKKRKYYWLGASGAFLASGYFFNSKADNHYDSYLASTSTSEATSLHNKVENNNRNSTISYGLSAAALIPVIINHLKQRDTASKLQVSGNTNKNSLLSLKYKF